MPTRKSVNNSNAASHRQLETLDLQNQPSMIGSDLRDAVEMHIQKKKLNESQSLSKISKGSKHQRSKSGQGFDKPNKSSRPALDATDRIRNTDS
jgi:hypothetical protein